MNPIEQIIVPCLIGIASGYIYEFIMSKVGRLSNKSKVVISKYKLHHSLYGLIFILIGLSTLTQYSIPLLALGVGIIIQHSLSGDGFVFITKEK